MVVHVLVACLAKFLVVRDLQKFAMAHGVLSYGNRTTVASITETLKRDCPSIAQHFERARPAKAILRYEIIET